MRTISLQKIYWLLLGLGFLFCVAVGIAQGQAPTSTTFQLAPALQEFAVDPGDSRELTLELYNHSGESVPFRVNSRNFLADGIDGQITFGDDDSSSYSAGDWIDVSVSDIIVPANDSQEVDLAIQVPANAEPGGHYASVLFEQVLPPTTTDDNSQVQVASRMAALIYFTVSGDVIEAGQVLGATEDGHCSAVVCGLGVPSFLDHGPVPFEFIFNNTGNVHVRPKGFITIRQFGREVAKVAVEDRAVLPNSQRLFKTSWDRSLLIGPYEAQLDLVYGSQDYKVSAKASFWAFPWQAVLILVVLVLVAGGIVLSRKFFRVKRLKG